MKAIIHFIALILNICAVLGLSIGCACCLIPPDKIGWAGFFGLAYTYLLLINIVFVIYWLFTRHRRRSAVSLLLIVLSWGFTSRIVHFGRNAMPDELHDRSFKVMTYNVHGFQPFDKEADMKFMPAFIELINNRQPDILCIQEFVNSSNEFAAKLAHDIGMQHFYIQPKVRKIGIATFSRYPIVDTQVIYVDNAINFCMFNDIVVRGDTIRVFNVHLKSNAFGDRQRLLLDNALRTGYSEDDVRTAKGIVVRLAITARQRARQVAAVKPFVNASPYPVMICGDFNDPPLSYTYQQMRGDLHDAFMEAGILYAPSYKIGNLSRQRIDYILHSSAIKAFDFDCPRIKLSDHLPVVCNFVIQNPEP